MLFDKSNKLLQGFHQLPGDEPKVSFPPTVYEGVIIFNGLTVGVLGPLDGSKTSAPVRKRQ